MGTSSTLKVGIGIPCHIRDIELLRKYSLPSINMLNPPPDLVVIYYNDGNVKGGLKKIREVILDEIFKTCDVALMVDTDYYLFKKDIIKYVYDNKVTNFRSVNKYPLSNIIKYIAVLLVKRPWCGLYSIPKKIWYGKVKDNWDGSDTSVQIAINKNYVYYIKPFYMLMRRNVPALIMVCLFHPLNRKRGLLSKIIKLMRLIPF